MEAVGVTGGIIKCLKRRGEFRSCATQPYGGDSETGILAIQARIEYLTRQAQQRIAEKRAALNGQYASCLTVAAFHGQQSHEARELTVHSQCRGEISMQSGGLSRSMELNFSDLTA